VANDYKKDARKPNVQRAVLSPFRRALLALAAMAEDMADRHKLRGASDPFNEWRQLPGAQERLEGAMARHGLFPVGTVNTKDGSHTHLAHDIWNRLAVLELLLEAQEKAAQPEPLHGPAGADWREPRKHADFAPLLARARAELWQQGERIPGQYWTGDCGTWFCQCGAGRPAACTCPRQSGV